MARIHFGNMRQGRPHRRCRHPLLMPSPEPEDDFTGIQLKRRHTSLSPLASTPKLSVPSSGLFPSLGSSAAPTPFDKGPSIAQKNHSSPASSSLLPPRHPSALRQTSSSAAAKSTTSPLCSRRPPSTSRPLSIVISPGAGCNVLLSDHFGFKGLPVPALQNSVSSASGSAYSNGLHNRPRLPARLRPPRPRLAR